MNLKKLEDVKREMLEQEEVEWRLKSRAIYMEKGDENTIFFQNYAKYRKNLNII
jgi:hypothetical protein